jgi:hypothetical protein
VRPTTACRPTDQLNVPVSDGEKLLLECVAITAASTATAMTASANITPKMIQPILVRRRAPAGSEVLRVSAMIPRISGARPMTAP